MTRLQFARRYALRHLLLSLLLGLLVAFVVFGCWYPMPYRAMLEVTGMFALLLAVDVVCGPLLVAILASPQKSRRARWVDWGLIGFIQLAALAYGLYSVWLARPVVLAFERDRLVVVSANEVDTPNLAQAPEGLRQLPWAGVRKVSTRNAANSEEFFQSVNLGLAGVSPAMRPGWWQPWAQQLATMRQRAKPLEELMLRSVDDREILTVAARETGLMPAQLSYLPLTSGKTKDWVALLDSQMNMVGYAPVDGF